MLFPRFLHFVKSVVRIYFSERHVFELEHTTAWIHMSSKLRVTRHSCGLPLVDECIEPNIIRLRRKLRESCLVTLVVFLPSSLGAEQ